MTQSHLPRFHLIFAASRAAVTDGVGIDLRRTQRLVVTSKVSHRRRVKARVLPLDRAAVERLAVLHARAKLERDRVAVPPSVATHFIGIQTSGVQRAVPAAEQSWLQRRERRAAQ